MPLILVCGKPCVGKTQFSITLGQLLREQHAQEVAIVSVESLGMRRASAYASESCAQPKFECTRPLAAFVRSTRWGESHTGRPHV
jgi:replicative DNA helicase